MSETGVIKGFKVFNPDWTCRGFQFEVGKTYEEDVKPMVCDRGFHFCEKAADCFNYYKFNPGNKVAEVIALGEVDSDGVKSCTDKIQIVREIPWDEVLRIVNTGKDCTGLCNTGNWNTGNWNTGDCNTGNRNTGNWNTGDCNTGNWNTGDCNTGDWNTGNRNTGNRNTGNWNTGDWNKSSFNTGCFMTEEPKISMFNRPSDWSYRDWLNSEARYFLNQIPGGALEYIYLSDMTDEEKAAHPEAETTGGYLKVLDNSERNVSWWKDLNTEEKQTIMEIPNFDKEIFKEITGINVDVD